MILSFNEELEAPLKFIFRFLIVEFKTSSLEAPLILISALSNVNLLIVAFDAPLISAFNSSQLISKIKLFLTSH